MTATHTPSDWFAGDVDCDGNELITLRADEVRRLRDEREKFMWQVRDTCARAEKTEASLSDLLAALNEIAAGGNPLGSGGVPSFAEMARRAIAKASGK